MMHGHTYIKWDCGVERLWEIGNFETETRDLAETKASAVYKAIAQSV